MKEFTPRNDCLFELLCQKKLYYNPDFSDGFYLL